MRPRRAHLEILSEHMPRSGTIVDVGCGDGTLTRRLAGGGAHVIGVDPSRDAIARARSCAGPHERYLVGGAERLPLPGGRADAVTFLNSLHHVPPPALRRALGEARRVLHATGLVYVQEPLAEGDYYELVRTVDDETQVRTAAQRALRDAAPAGLKLIEELEYEAPVRHSDFGAFRERMVLADERRVCRFQACAAELEERFYRAAERAAEGWTFRQPMRVTVLRPLPTTPEET